VEASEPPQPTNAAKATATTAPIAVSGVHRPAAVDQNLAALKDAAEKIDGEQNQDDDDENSDDGQDELLGWFLVWW
jgi:hypothetical protein